MVTASDLVHDGAQRLSSVADKGKVRSTNVTAGGDDGGSGGRTERPRSNAFPDGTTDEGAWTE